MRVSNWNPQRYDGEFRNASMERLKAAAEVVAQKTKLNIMSYVRWAISHPPYKTGKYANEPWTAREAGAMLKSVRVVTKHEKYSTLLLKINNVRVYVGNYMVWYAAAFEFAKTAKRGHSVLRTALRASESEVRNILENGK
jgi:hypothetical protein